MSRSIALLLALVLPAVATAVPLAFTHQGRIADSTGVALEGDHDVTFTLYTDPAGTESAWTETQVLSFDAGYFTADIGAVTALDPTTFDGQDLWLGITVDGGAELPQRLPLNSVPYAVRADSATNVAGGVVDASEVKINGTTVIDSTGALTGAASWSTLTDIPDDFSDDTDNDTLGELQSCTDGQVAAFDGGAWACAEVDLSALNADNLTSGTVDVARLPVGTGGTDVAAGDHGHDAYLPLTGGTLSGGLQLGNTSDDTCDSNAAGTFRWANDAAQVCDGSAWRTLSSAAAKDGSSEANPATTCKSLLAEDPNITSGVRWIDPDGDGGKGAFKVFCDMGTAGGGWSVFARVFEENNQYRYGFDAVDNGFDLKADTFADIEGVSFNELIFIRRDSGEFYSVQLDSPATWPTDGSSYNAGNGYTIAANPSASGQVIRAYDADNGKHFQFCFLDSHNDECGPNSASDPNNYGDAGGNDDQNMLWAGEEVHAIGTGITWDFAFR